MQDPCLVGLPKHSHMTARRLLCKDYFMVLIKVLIRDLCLFGFPITLIVAHIDRYPMKRSRRLARLWCMDPKSRCYIATWRFPKMKGQTIGPKLSLQGHPLFKKQPHTNP